MVTFGEITQRNLRIGYVKEDIEGYKVVGNANYDKDNRLTDAYGGITDSEGLHIANFNAYGSGDSARVNLTDCVVGMMNEAVSVAEATLADLSSTYPTAE